MFTYSTVKYLIYLGGIYSIGFAIFHIYFWRLFDWKNDLQKLKAPNKAIIQIANLRLIYIFFGIALVCFVFPRELLSSKLGNAFLLGISLFWLGRTIEQFIFLRIKNKMVNILTALFILGTLLFAAPVLIKIFLFTPCI
ncbi:hypothetical protein [Pedobacter frigiditerrae]|uniref:hypothetical protein n=1 Tax=Pedobacter frigiditerrae TaxID=2530452 RepID=UPI00292D9168|nr:hypothetical protein [Pedobacter frigiditerrae]